MRFLRIWPAARNACVSQTAASLQKARRFQKLILFIEVFLLKENVIIVDSTYF